MRMAQQAKACSYHVVHEELPILLRDNVQERRVSGAAIEQLVLEGVAKQAVRAQQERRSNGAHGRRVGALQPCAPFADPLSGHCIVQAALQVRKRCTTLVGCGQRAALALLALALGLHTARGLLRALSIRFTLWASHTVPHEPLP